MSHRRESRWFPIAAPLSGRATAVGTLRAYILQPYIELDLEHV